MFLPVLLGGLSITTGIASSVVAAATTAIAGTAAAGAIAAVGAATGLASGKTVFGGTTVQLRLTKRVFNTVEAMKILGLSKPTILKKLKDKELHYEGNGGKGGYNISQKDIESYAKKHKITPNWDDFIIPDLTEEEIELQHQAVYDVENDPDMLDALIKIIEADQKGLVLELKMLDLKESSVKATQEFKQKCIEIEQMINEYDKIINVYRIRLIKLKYGDRNL